MLHSRVGWVHTKDAALLAQVSKRAVFVSGGVSCQLASRIVGQAIDTGTLDQHLVEVYTTCFYNAMLLMLSYMINSLCELIFL
jgi:hypothetical protein